MSKFKEVPLLIDDDSPSRTKRTPYFTKNKLWAIAILFICWTAGSSFLVPYEVSFWRLYLAQALPAIGAVIYWVKFHDLK